MKKKTIAAILAAAVIASAAYIVVYATGTVNDPLITLSYLNQVLLPDIMVKVEAKMAEKAPAVNPTDREAIKNEILAALGKDGITPPSTDPNVPTTPAATDASFSAINLKEGQVIVGDAGGIEVLLRTGGFTSVVPGEDKLINITAASEIGDKAELTLQNYYLIARNDGRGVRATTDSWLMVRGSYKIVE